MVSEDAPPVVVHDGSAASGPPPGPPPEESPGPALLAGVATTLLPGLAKARHPLEAELVLASLVGIMIEGIPAEVDDDERAAALTALLSDLIEYCERLDTPEAVGFLRLAGQQGPAPTRRSAEQAVQRMTERGVRDLPWASSVGSPTVLRAWRYGDVFGSQSSIGVLFAYRSREHAVSVLIDHGLGGGVKDAWVAAGRDARGLRDRVAEAMVGEPVSYFEDITEGQALEGLRATLAEPPCPEQPDQVEDVATHLYLVHARAQLLARLLGEPEVELFADTLVDAGDPSTPR